MITGMIKIELDFVFERQDSIHVKWRIHEDQSDLPKEYRDWDNDIGCFETETWGLPGDHTGIEPGDLLHVRGPATIVFTESCTDCGTEYDAHIDFDESLMYVKIYKHPEEFPGFDTESSGIQCGKCSKPGTKEIHECPYDADINNDDSLKCHCCEDCQYECSMDI